MENQPNPAPSQVPEDGSFIKKSVDQPIFDSGVREKIITLPETSDAKSPGFFKANKFYILAIVVGLLVIGVLAFLAFRPKQSSQVKEANVAVSIEAPESASSGGETVYQIKIENKDSQTLVNLQLELIYQSGVMYLSSSPKADNLSGSLFGVPNLISGQNAVVMVKTKIVGNVNDSKQLLARLHYKYSNFNSEFVKEASASTRLVASDIILEINGPTSANNAQLIVYTVHYKNSSNTEIKNARISLIYPDGFSYASATPLPDLENSIWSLGSLASGGEGEISVQGNFLSTGPGESKTLSGDFLVLGQDGQYFIQNSASFSTAIASTPLIVLQSLSGSSSNNIAKPGDTLEYSISYQNNSVTAATGVNIIVTLNSKALDLSSLQAEGAVVNNNTLLWNAASLAKLENLAPNEKGQLSFTVKVNNPATKDSTKNLTAISSIKIKSNEFESYFSGNDLTVKISSPVKLTAVVDYLSGSLPPKVGKSTTYKATLSLFNSSNDFQDGILTAFIPLGPGGFVQGSITGAEGPNVEYDSAAGKLTWKVGSLPAFAGKFSQARSLEFQIKLTPASSQVNQSPVLIKDIKFNAKDSFTGQQTEVIASNLDTSDLTSQDGYINGQVQK